MIRYLCNPTTKTKRGGGIIQEKYERYVDLNHPLHFPDTRGSYERYVDGNYILHEYINFEEGVRRTVIQNKFDRNEIHKDTTTYYDLEGYDVWGYDSDGYDKKGFDVMGIHKNTGTYYDKEDYDIWGYNRKGYNKKWSRSSTS